MFAGMPTPLKQFVNGHQGNIFQHFRSSQHPPQPFVEDESDDGADEIPFRAPAANMERPPTHIKTQPHSTEEQSHSQQAEDALRAEINRVNDEADAQDEDFNPAAHKRKSDAEIGPSKKSKINPSAAKPYEQCCVEVRAKRDELIAKIGKVWSDDHTTWPTHPFAPARASVVLEPKDWGKPILLKVAEMTRAENSKSKASSALSNAIAARSEATGERIWMTTNDLDAAIRTLTSKEPVREPIPPRTSDTEEDIEVALPQAPNQNNPTDTPNNAKAKQDARIKAVRESVRHLDTQTLRALACYMIDVADLRDEHEKDLKKREAALALACSGL